MNGVKGEETTQAEAVRALRKITGLNRTEFAKAQGIPLRTLEEWESGRRKMPDYVLRLLSYKIHFEQCSETQNKNVNIIKDEKGYSIVVINDIRFKGKQHIKWDEVEKFLKEYIGQCYEIMETSDKIYIGSDFPGELKGSDDTKRLKGGNAKAKANATQELPLLIKTANNKRWSVNYKSKHKSDAENGWFRYTARFALPTYSNDGELEKYNIFRVEMLVRHASDGKLYLYDMVNVKKEKETEYPA